MVRDSNNMIPVTMALLLHVLLFGALFLAVDFRARATPVVPLAIKGTLVPEIAAVQPPKVVEPPAPQPEPEPDTSEQDRLRAEELKRLEDARVEQDRLSRIKKAEEEAAAERILRMGEDPWRVHVVGSLYVDRIVSRSYTPVAAARARFRQTHSTQ